MATPVAVETDVGNASNTHQTLWSHEAEELTPHRSQIDQMA